MTRTDVAGVSALFVVLVAMSVSIGACRGKSEPPAEQPAAAQSAGVLVFEDDFARDSLGPNWSTTSEAWRLEDGWVAVERAYNHGLWLTEPLPEAVRVEFIAKSLSPDGDIKFEIFTDGQTHESGYVGIFGGWQNRLNIIARLDEHGDDRVVGAAGVSVEEGREYRFAIERTGGRVDWFIDGQPFLSFDDESPLRGDGHRHFGFNDWETPVRFRSLRVYDLAGTP